MLRRLPEDSQKENIGQSIKLLPLLFAIFTGSRPIGTTKINNFI
jgi:hypothetical protein